MPRHEYCHGYYMMVVHQVCKTKNLKKEEENETSYNINDK